MRFIIKTEVEDKNIEFSVDVDSEEEIEREVSAYISKIGWNVSKVKIKNYKKILNKENS